MFRICLLFAALVAVSSLALAQGKTQEEALAEKSFVVGDATTSCNVTFSSGIGVNATKFCVTANGNITQFSVGGHELIAVGQTGEGYGICDSTTGEIGYYDYGYEDSGNWQSPIFTHSGNVVTVTRTTSDGIWQLKQTITHVPATAAGPGSAKVSMALKNLSGTPRFAEILRYADVDPGDYSHDDFDYTQYTAFGLDPSSSNSVGMSITNNTFNTNVADPIAYALSTFNGPFPCSEETSDRPFNGDGSIVMQWFFSEFAHNATKTVVSTYKPI
jgi:hypothetical protein